MPSVAAVLFFPFPADSDDEAATTVPSAGSVLTSGCVLEQAATAASNARTAAFFSISLPSRSDFGLCQPEMESQIRAVVQPT